MDRSGFPASPATYTPPGSTPSTWRYGNFWQRLGAILLDTILLSVIGIVVVIAMGQAAGGLVNFVIGAAYYTIGNGWGGTPGKRALGLRVVTAEGEEAGLGRGFVRYLVSIVSGLALLIGYLWMIWDSQNQTWHDKAAGTYVIEA